MKKNSLNILTLGLSVLLASCEIIDPGIAIDRSAIDSALKTEAFVVNTADNCRQSSIRMADKSVSVSLEGVLNRESTGSVSISLDIDEDYVSIYNELHGTSYGFFPGTVSISSGIIEIEAGNDRSESVVVNLKPVSSMKEDKQYLLPISIRSDEVPMSADHCLLIIEDVRNGLKETDKGNGAVKSVVYVEVNNVNPLNALEFRLENSGKLFFDQVILFSANINWSKTEKRVYLKCNQSVQFLLDHSEQYIKPLQDKGIKVILSVLGNHDESGVAQLSELGAREFARELAAYCEAYGLDGVGFDDEYSKNPDVSNPWLTYTSTEAAARLLYETKKAMPGKIVMAYYLNHLNASLPSIDGVKPGNFVDYVVPDYAGSVPAAPLTGMTKANCAGAAINLTYGGGSLEERNLAKSNKDAGYGYYMFYNLDPSLWSTQVNRLDNISYGLYNQGITAPTGYYKYQQTNKTNL
ncbi:MAG: BT_3987 domain-containing protein [Candidatus Cryptobacteroides sp.]